MITAKERSLLSELATEDNYYFDSPPRWCYTSQDWHDLEVACIFRQSWLFACLASDLDQPGAFVTREFVGRSVLIVRTASGSIKAYLNTCRHRGAPLTLEHRGHVRNFVCPFHKWAYDLDGRLIHAPGLEEEVDRNELAMIGSNLIEIHASAAHNLVFIHFANTPAVSLAGQLGNFSSAVAEPHGLENMRCVEHWNYNLNCNWKLYVEVDMETLHIPHVHQKSIGKQAVYPVETIGDWISLYYESDQTPALRPGAEVTPLPINPEAYGVGRAGAHYSMLFPGFFFIAAQDAVWWIQKTPVDPGTVNVDVGVCFHRSVVEDDEHSETLPHYLERIRAVISEDDMITQYQQKGLASAGERGRLTPKERQVHEIDAWVISRVLQHAA